MSRANSASNRKRSCPTRAVAITQQLALMFPADGPLLWQLAELANAYGDLPSAAAMMEGCVTPIQHARHRHLQKHRQILREAVDESARAGSRRRAWKRTSHVGTLAFRSRRPLISQADWPGRCRRSIRRGSIRSRGSSSAKQRSRSHSSRASRNICKSSKASRSR